MTGAKVAPNRPYITGTTARGRNVRSRDAAHNRKIASSARRGHAIFTVCPNEGDTFAIVVNGRTLWALRQLMAAGDIGVTPGRMPAPRWSAYIHELRQRGVQIETVREPHGGRFPGWHGRYVLRCHVSKGGAQ